MFLTLHFFQYSSFSIFGNTHPRKNPTAPPSTSHTNIFSANIKSILWFSSEGFLFLTNSTNQVFFSFFHQLPNDESESYHPEFSHLTFLDKASWPSKFFRPGCSSSPSICNQSAETTKTTIAVYKNIPIFDFYLTCSLPLPVMLVRGQGTTLPMPQTWL